MNIEHFHNELAMRLGYERIVEDKRIYISVEESNDPCVELTLQNGVVIRMKASANPDDVNFLLSSEMFNVVKDIIGVVHQAYVNAISYRF